MYGLAQVSPGQCNAPLPPGKVWYDQGQACEWLTPADAAKVGQVCFSPPVYVGRWKVGGNLDSTTLYCGDELIPGKKGSGDLVSGVALGAVGYFLLPSPFNWVALIGGVAWGWLGYGLANSGGF